MGDLVKIDVSGVDFYYGSQKALHSVSMKIREHFVTALIGPSGCGKSTFLRALNRMNDLIPGARLAGKVNLDGEDIYSSAMDVIHLRRRVGMIFQRSNRFRYPSMNAPIRVRVNGLTRPPKAQ
jgi:phosphate transport system ATP-binding protein